SRHTGRLWSSDRRREKKQCGRAEGARRAYGGQRSRRASHRAGGNEVNGMLHHERLKPPLEDYPPNPWSLVETKFCPEFLAQMESVLAIGNGYLGMRGCHEEGSPCVQNGTFVNGFYESWPIVYGEEAYGFARTGQTMLNVTDSKIIKLY